MNASSSSFPAVVENALVTTVVAALARSPNAVASTLGPTAPLTTVTVTAADVPVLLAASRATAVNA